MHLLNSISCSLHISHSVVIYGRHIYKRGLLVGIFKFVKTHRQIRTEVHEKEAGFPILRLPEKTGIYLIGVPMRLSNLHCGAIPSSA